VLPRAGVLQQRVAPRSDQFTRGIQFIRSRRDATFMI
jgi:hypothetical protein